MKLSTFFRQLTNTLLERGWCQLTYESARGELCLAGVMNLTVFGQADFMATPERPTPLSQLHFMRQAHDLMRELVQQRDGMQVRSIADWNDVPGRTPDQVLALLDACYDEAVTRESVEAASQAALVSA